MPKKRDILVLMVIFSFLLTGCQLVGSKTQGSIPDSSSAFKGSDGLVLSFFDDAPPDNLIPDSEFKIAVLLENKGAADIKCDETSGSCGYYLAFAKEPISGVTPSSGELKDALLEDEKNKEQYTILGKESYLSGGRAAMEFSDKVKVDVKSTTTALVAFMACYPYETSLSAPVCVQTAHYTVPEKSRTCELKTLSFSNQGAPVAITKIEQESILSGSYVKPRFKIYISEVGKGTVLAKEPESLKKACTSDTTNLKDVIGLVTIEEATISGKQLDCQETKEGKKKTIALTGISKNDFIECSPVESKLFSAGASNNLVAPLKIVLGYGYQTAISKDVKIEVLDTIPKIKRFSVVPEVPTSGEPLTIFVLAEDDKGLDKIELRIELSKLSMDDKGNPVTVVVGTHPCDGALSCSHIFKGQTAPAKVGESFTYTAQSFDTSGRESETKTVSGTVGGITVTITVPAQAVAGSEITIAASAKSTFTKLTKLELIYSDGTALGASYTYTCKSRECSTIFKVGTLASSVGSIYPYKIRATDSEGNIQLSEEGKVTLVAPAPPVALGDDDFY